MAVNTTPLTAHDNHMQWELQMLCHLCKCLGNNRLRSFEKTGKINEIGNRQERGEGTARTKACCIPGRGDDDTSCSKMKREGGTHGQCELKNSVEEEKKTYKDIQTCNKASELAWAFMLLPLP